ncbi:MAG: sugar ABC transporter ATP-binding protein [Propionivibrio sp.]|nr:sugar ABC transporter ATP-binding protein [Propionivibrio sp.]MBP7523181.1 sugar ABC transporter ATP-binding protein [Propionivibrio sp.]
MNESVMEMKGVGKSFPGVTALKGIDLAIRRNEILGLVGENGAGKSTLMKIMMGLQNPDEGELLLRGEKVQFEGPSDAIRQGVGMVFQEGCMIPNLSVVDNLFLGNEASFMRLGFISAGKTAKAARELLSTVGLASLDLQSTVGELPAATKQMLEIARLLWLSAYYGTENPILILDEPTTVLQDAEAAILFKILGELKKKATIVFISHRLEEVVTLSDRIVVLKDGHLMAEMSRGEADVKRIENLMVGHEMAEEHYRESMQTEPTAEVVLRAKALSLSGHFENFALELHSGEIVALVGLLGSGKEEVCACLGGLRNADLGSIEVRGSPVRFSSPKDAIAAGIGCIPIDRRNDGLATSLDVMSNINLLVLSGMRKGPFIIPALEQKNAQRWVSECLIKTPSLQTATGTLSGGNQQKVVIAKWLAAEAGILILDHPTRGIDVGAKDEIYRRIRELAAAGLSIIVMCDTLEEDIGLANRMIVMKDGRVVREIDCPSDAKPAPIDVIGYIV